jgi:hypothetical protein
MGSSTSKKVLSQEEAEALCAHRFDLDTFNANKNAQGRIRTSFLKKQAFSLNEEEVHTIFNSYCPRGTMNVVTWVKFCKESKLFSRKKKFLLPDAHLIFQKAFSNRCDSSVPRRTSVLSTILKSPSSKGGGRINNCETKTREVHFAAFRFVMLLAVAVHKRTDIDVLLSAIIKNQASNKSKCITEAPEQLLKFQPKKNSRYEMNFHHQTEHYQKQARLILKKLETLKTPANNPAAIPMTQRKRQELYKSLGSTSSEDKLHAIFSSYTGGSLVMALDQFVLMCEACDLVQSDFQISDAKLVFKNAILLASSPTAGKTLNDGIVDEEFMKYGIFRGFAVPHIAQKKKKNCADIIELFI